MKPHQLITAKITATNGGGTSEPSNEVTGRSLEGGMVNITYLVHLFIYHYLYSSWDSGNK